MDGVSKEWGCHRDVIEIILYMLYIYIYVLKCELEIVLRNNFGCSIPDAPCMVYLPTFTINNQPNLGNDSIHGSYRYGNTTRITTSFRSHLVTSSVKNCESNRFP